jgi:hypothetical protein
MKYISKKLTHTYTPKKLAVTVVFFFMQPFIEVNKEQPDKRLDKLQFLGKILLRMQIKKQMNRSCILFVIIFF